MREDINHLRVGDIRSARNIRRTRQKNSVIANDPLESIVGNDRHMFSRLQTQGDEGGREIEAFFVKLAEGNRKKIPRAVLAAKSGHSVVATSGIGKNLGQSGAVFIVGHPDSSNRPVQICQFVSTPFHIESKLYLGDPAD